MTETKNDTHAHDLKEKNIYIIGFMGSGKTTVGKELAAKLDYAFTDLDTLIEHSEGKTISKIFTAEGEGAFREAEKKCLQTTFTHTATVISCGGGTPCFYNNMQQMNKYGVTVYIEMNPKELFSRLKGAKVKRPLLGGTSDDEILAGISDLLFKREAFYKQAKVIVRGIDLKPANLAGIIKGIL